MPVTRGVNGDQIGVLWFPYISSNKYLFILYDDNMYSIHFAPIPSQTKLQILWAYKTRYNMLKLSDFEPKLHYLDNEETDMLQGIISSEGVDFQLTPAGIHRQNTAERVIQAFNTSYCCRSLLSRPKILAKPVG